MTVVTEIRSGDFTPQDLERMVRINPSIKIVETEGRTPGIGAPWGAGPMTAAFDESKHPRNPATGRDNKESPGDGGKFRSSKGGASDTAKKDEQSVDFVAPEKDDVARKVLGDAPDTQHLYAGPVDGYTQERVDDWQDPVIAHYLTRGDEGMPTPVGGQAEPTTLFLAGGSGSGKSTVLEALGDVKPPDAVMVNPDLIKEAMPEYREMVAGKSKYSAAGAHEESSDVSKRLLTQAVKGDYNVIVDGTGNSGEGKFLRKIDQQKKLGRKVKVVMVDIPTDEAIRRADKRAARTGRYVAPEEIRKIHKSVAVNHLAWRDKVDDWEVWANDTRPPKLVARRVGGGKMEVLDAKRYKQAVDKAKE